MTVALVDRKEVQSVDVMFTFIYSVRIFLYNIFIYIQRIKNVRDSHHIFLVQSIPIVLW